MLILTYICSKINTITHGGIWVLFLHDIPCIYQLSTHDTDSKSKAIRCSRPQQTDLVTQQREMSYKQKNMCQQVETSISHRFFTAEDIL